MRDYEYDDGLDGLLIIWKCDQCGKEHEEPVGYNEGGRCMCGGRFVQTGESYPA